MAGEEQRREGKGPEKRESDTSSNAEDQLQEALPIWSPGASAAPPATSREGRLARSEFKDAIESLLDPGFRFQVASRDFRSALRESSDHERALLALLGDGCRLLAGVLNRRIDRLLGFKSLQILAARVTGRRHHVDALRQEIPFVVREIVAIDNGGQVLAAAARAGDDARTAKLLETGSGAAGKGGRSGIDKLLHIAASNNTPEHNLILSHGSRATIVAAVQGAPPRGYRRRLHLTRAAVEAALELPASAPREGGGARRSRVEQHLRDLLAVPESRLHRPLPWLQGFAILAIAGLVAAIYAAATAHFEQQRWGRLASEISAIPGIQVTQVSSSRPLFLTAFRDPLAPDPTPLLREHGFDPGEAVLTLIPFKSSNNAIVEKRALKILAPPETVALRFLDDTLFLIGSSSHLWLAHCDSARLRLLPEIAVDLSGVTDLDLEACQATARDILEFRFEKNQLEGTGALAAKGDVAAAAALVARLQKGARSANLSLEVRIIGRDYQTRSQELTPENLRSAHEHAGRLRDLLLALEPDIDPLVLRSLGERPLAIDTFDAPHRNRSVEFAIDLEGEVLVPGKQPELSVNPGN